jgi:hypothetical protein
VARWNNGRILTEGADGGVWFEGEEVTTGWLKVIMRSFFNVQRVLRWIRGTGNVAYMSGGICMEKVGCEGRRQEPVWNTKVLVGS